MIASSEAGKELGVWECGDDAPWRTMTHRDLSKQGNVQNAWRVGSWQELS